MLTPRVYQTSVSIWVEQPAYLDLKDTSSPWASAVETQSSRLGDLLHTRAFAVDVAQRTSLAPLVGSPAGDQLVEDLISRGVTLGGPGLSPTGTTSQHLLVIQVQAATAQLSYEFCKAIVDAYQDKMQADQADQASIGVDFYQSQVQDAQQRLTAANQDLRRYVQAQQSSNADQTSDQSTFTAAMLDPKLGTLQANVQEAQGALNSAQSALQQAQQAASAAEQGQQYGFQVLDPPQAPSAPVVQTKKIIIYPIAAEVIGLGLSGMLLVLLVTSDRSVRSELDLTAGGFRVLGTVPSLRLKRMPKQLRSVATRRAIGAAAGTALPSPTGAR
jgi:hypothetical protein